jgi:hypothetical protein
MSALLESQIDFSKVHFRDDLVHQIARLHGDDYDKAYAYATALVKELKSTKKKKKLKLAQEAVSLIEAHLAEDTIDFYL